MLLLRSHALCACHHDLGSGCSIVNSSLIPPFLTIITDNTQTSVITPSHTSAKQRSPAGYGTDIDRSPSDTSSGPLFVLHPSHISFSTYIQLDFAVSSVALLVLIIPGRAAHGLTTEYCIQRNSCYGITTCIVIDIGSQKPPPSSSSPVCQFTAKESNTNIALAKPIYWGRRARVT